MNKTKQYEEEFKAQMKEQQCKIVIITSQYAIVDYLPHGEYIKMKEEAIGTTPNILFFHKRNKNGSFQKESFIIFNHDIAEIMKYFTTPYTQADIMIKWND